MTTKMIPTSNDILAVFENEKTWQDRLRRQLRMLGFEMTESWSPTTPLPIEDGMKWYPTVSPMRDGTVLAAVERGSMRNRFRSNDYGQTWQVWND